MPRYLLGVLLLLLVSVSEMQAQGDVVLYIEGKPVYRSEFEYYYRKAPEQTPEAYLPAFINYKLKVRYAMDSGLDTVSAFRRQLSFYEGRLVKSYVVDAGMEEQEARFIYERNKQRLQTNDWVRIAHISKYLPQNATPAAEQAAQAVMDSIYSALRSGADFSLLARRYSDDADSRQVGGLLPWMPVNKNMQEWVNKLTVLEKNKISVPFYSPLGLHIVKWVERKPFASYHDKKEEIQAYMEHGGVCSSSVRKDVLALYLSGALAGKYPDWALRLQEVHDGLLVSYLTRKYQETEYACSEADLEHYFKQHKSDYAWDLPRYKGAVIHCRNKKMASVIKKYLKKKPMEEWKSALEKLMMHTAVPQASIEVGVFIIGKNQYVDKLVFKCGSFEQVPGFSYTFVMGKKLKKGPESYLDVKESVIRDYQAIHEDSWMKELKRKYKVEINQEVLKTVNNNGSN